MQEHLSIEVAVGDSQHELPIFLCESDLGCLGILMVAAVTESFVQEMENFSHQSIIDTWLRSGFGPYLDVGGLTNLHVKRRMPGNIPPTVSLPSSASGSYVGADCSHLE
jgi:hypothetical protein